MKKNLLFVTALFSAIVLFTSCKKEKTDEIRNVTLNATTNAGETYKLDLAQYGDADDIATITTQANTFATSEVVKSGVIGEYNFMKAGSPKVGGNGNEVVVLKISEGQRECGNNNGANNQGREHHGKKHHVDETNITINFTIL